MKHLILLLALAVGLLGQPQAIVDTLTTPQGGTFSGTIVVTLNNPATAQPLYYSSTTLSGWQQSYTITSGAVSISLYANSTIIPTGTSYTARFTPASGLAWSETWVVPVGATTIREVRSTTVPTPSVLFLPSQLRQQGATVGQGLVWNGAAYAPSSVVADPMTTTGDLITRAGGVPTRLGIGSTGQVLTVAGGLPSWAAPATSGTVTSVSVTTANGVSGTVATATSTPAISLTLGAITPTSVAASGTVTGSNLSGTNTGDQTTITGNAGTATALAANGGNCSAGQFPLGVSASGAAESCTALPTTIAGTANQITASASTTLPGTTTGTFSGNLTGNVTGNAATATVLETPRTIAGVSFNGSANIAIPSTGLSDTADIVRGGASVAATQVLYGTGAGVAGSESAFAYTGAGGATKVLSIAASTQSRISTISGSRNIQIDSYAGDQSYIFGNGSTLSIGTGSSNIFSIWTNNTERARFAATTGNLLLGTTTDDGVNKLQVAGNISATSAAGGEMMKITATAGSASFLSVGSTEGNIILQDSGATTGQQAFNLNSNDGVLSFRLLNDARFGVNGTFAKLNSVGQWYFMDDRATVGSTLFTIGYNGTSASAVYTQLIVRAGTGQSSTNLQTWQNAAGTTISQINSNGNFDWYTGGNRLANYGGNAIVASTGQFAFSSTSTITGTQDLTLDRQAAGVLRISNTGTTGGGLLIEALKSTTGVRYVCVDTTGRITSQAAACVGT